MDKHSPEPWILGWWAHSSMERRYVFTPPPDDDDTHTGFFEIFSGFNYGDVRASDNFYENDGMVVGTDGDQYEPAMVLKKVDAIRIVACVNACRGLNPEHVPELVASIKALLDSHQELLERCLLHDAFLNHAQQLEAGVAGMRAKELLAKVKQ